jgi:NADPH2:quinone reductase
MTQRVVATAFGGPEVLSLVDIDVAPPGPGEVLVQVRAVGTNPIDYKLYSGTMGNDPSTLPMAIGSEASGIVEAVGAEAVGPAGRIAVGDEVILYPVTGAYASAVLAPVTAVVPKPAGLSFEAASGLLLTGATAIHALTVTKVTANDTVLIHGASGGVGLMAVQVAVHRGARVIGTASPANHDTLRQLGVEPVAYGQGLLERVRAVAPEGVDAAIICTGTDEAIDVSLEVVVDQARITTIVRSERATERGVQRLGLGPGGDPGVDIRAAARLELVDLVEQGALSVEVAATFPLAQAAEAHRQLAEGHTRGKIVLIP